jgi:hypothetical protein
LFTRLHTGTSDSILSIICWWSVISLGPLIPCLTTRSLD